MAVNKTIIGKEVLPDGRILEYGARDPVTGQRYEILHPAPTPTGTTPTTPTPTSTPTPTPTSTPALGETTVYRLNPTTGKLQSGNVTDPGNALKSGWYASPEVIPGYAITQSLGTPTPGNYYWTIKNGAAVIVDASGNPVDTTTQTNILMNVGWDFTKIPKYGATTPTTPTAPTTSQPVAPSPISGATTIPKTIKVQGFDIDPTTGEPINIQTGQPLTPTQPQTPTQTTTTPMTPKTTTQTTPQIEAIQAQLKDLQAQQAAMTQYGVSDTNMLEKDVNGNYVPKEVAPKTPDQVRDEVYTKYGIDTAIKDWANAPTKSFEEIYKEILTNSGIADIKASIDKITADINKADADYNTAVGDINDNPWISEAGRVGKIEKLNINYEQTRKRLDNQLTLATGQQDKLKEEASKIATETLTAYDKQHQYDKAILDFYITRAEAEIEAELTAQTEEQTFRYQTYPDYLTKMKALTTPEKPTIVGSEKLGYYAYYPDGTKTLILGGVGENSELGELLTIDQSAKYGVPYGTTKGQLMGQTLSANAGKAESNYVKIGLEAVKAIKSLDGFAVTVESDGTWKYDSNRVKGLTGEIHKLNSMMNPDARTLKMNIDSAILSMIYNNTGKTMNEKELDAQRGIYMPQYWDDADSAMKRIAKLETDFMLSFAGSYAYQEVGEEYTSGSVVSINGTNSTVQ